MHLMIKSGSVAAAVLAFVFSMLTAGCKFTARDDAVEYVNKEVSYASGESCEERYLLYEKDGKYERWIAGKYYGKELPGIFGTCFETGTYEEVNSSSNIKFYPKS